MSISAFELLKIGIGPSSSHTVGPMKAANAFLKLLQRNNFFKDNKISRVKAELFGSLALTGKGHGTDKAILLGLEGHEPRTVPIQSLIERFKNISTTNKLNLNGQLQIDFPMRENLLFHKKKILPYHTNGMKFTAFDGIGEKLLSMNYYSIGGGFFLSQEDIDMKSTKTEKKLPFPYSTGKEMILQCENNNMTLA